MFLLLTAQNCVRRLKEVIHRASLPHELGVVADMEIAARATSTCAFKSRNDY